VPIAFEPGTRTTHEVSADVHLRPSATLYRGKTVMLIDERAQSQSEHTALLFRAVHGTVLIGSPTAGANGTGSNFSVPGGLLVGLRGDGVSSPDGSQLQRVGLRPDRTSAADDRRHPSGPRRGARRGGGIRPARIPRSEALTRSDNHSHLSFTWSCRTGKAAEPSAEVFHEHDIAAAVVLLGIENPSPVGRHGNPRHKRDRFSVQRGNVNYPAPGKAQKL